MVSLSLMAVIYLVNQGKEFGAFGLHLCFDVPVAVSYVIYVALCIFLTWLCSLAFSKLETMNLSNSNVNNIESADSTFVPMYFAYVFVGVSIQSNDSLIWCYLLTTVICYCAQIYYFNPLFYLLGYRYYFVTNSTDKKLLVMTRKRIYLNQNVDFTHLKRLNDYSYVDIS